MALQNKNLRPTGDMARRTCAAVFLLTAARLTAAPAYGAEKLKVGDEPSPIHWQAKLSRYRGRIVMIAFWASWCPPWRLEMGVLAQIQKAATRKR